MVVWIGLALDERYVDGWVEECLQRIGEDYPEEELLFRDLFEDETQRKVVIDSLKADCEVRVGGLACLLPFLPRLGTQPQRDVRRLQSLPHHSHQFAVQCLQVGLLSQLRRECLKRLSGVVLPTIEPAVH